MSKNARTDDIRTEDLTEAIREVRDRVRSRNPNGMVGGLALPNLLPIVHARDAAQGKVAAIGTVNPRPGGFANSIIQNVKKVVSRALDWHVREQVEFNRATLECVQAILETFEENNRALAQLAGQGGPANLPAEFAAFREEMASSIAKVQEELGGANDIRAHWSQWRQGWEEKLNRSEVYMLRTISELNASFQLRATTVENSFRDAMKDQHTGFGLKLDKVSGDIQQRLWDELRQVRTEFERLIHYELRFVRQRIAAQPAVAGEQPPAEPIPQLDWLKFSDRFRGSEESIRAHQKLYTDRFTGATNVLDVGCGRGEFLEAARDAGIGAHGIDLNSEAVELCRRKNLQAETADVFGYLNQRPDGSQGGLYCSQVVEHLTPVQLPELIRLAAAKLQPGALLAIETPNPECLAIFATHFYLDPTHTRPVPPLLLAFYLEEAGFGQIEILRLHPAEESIPALKELPGSVRQTLFGGLDYAIFARRL